MAAGYGRCAHGRPDAVEIVVSQLEGARPRPAPGRPRSCRRASPDTSRPGSMTLPRRTPGVGAAQTPRRAYGRKRARRGSVRTTPITLLARRHAPLWAALCPTPDAGQLSGRAQAVVDCIRQHGVVLRRAGRWHRPAAAASRRGAGRAGQPWPGEFGQLRRLARSARPLGSAQRQPLRAASASVLAVRHGGRRPMGAGSPAPADADRTAIRSRAVEHVARTLLRRYGVVFWRLLEREAAWLPPGGSCCGSIAGSKRAATSAAAVSSPASPANSSRCLTPSAYFARPGATSSGPVSLSGADRSTSRAS